MTTLGHVPFDRAVMENAGAYAGRIPELRELQAARSAEARHRNAVLSRTVELEIVPRLVLAHRAMPAPTLDMMPAGSVEHLTGLVLDGRAASASSFVGEMQARGATLDSIYLDLLAPVARHLGRLWEEDLCDFGLVTTALLHMHKILRDLRPADVADSEQDGTRRALLVPAPGDQHSFGLAMVADFFRRAGWAESAADLTRLVRDRWFAVVGFSASCDQRLDSLGPAIRHVRRTSRNRQIRVMVGGPSFIANPALVALIGADATAADGREAVIQAQNLLALLPARR